MTGPGNCWTLTTQLNGEDMVVLLPQDMLDAVGWGAGDVLTWTNNKDGSWSLKKKEVE